MLKTRQEKVGNVGKFQNVSDIKKIDTIRRNTSINKEFISTKQCQ
jgi:hypothetical protein